MGVKLLNIKISFYLSFSLNKYNLDITVVSLGKTGFYPDFILLVMLIEI